MKDGRRFAPKGRDIKAQGNALGKTWSLHGEAPKGRQNEWVHQLCRTFGAWDLVCRRLPRALPWALASRTIGAQIVAMTVLLIPMALGAAEISTNGLGGGPWSDPMTWRGKLVPKADDDVVIQKNDVAIFDRNDDGKVSCRKLLIDPKGALVFKTNAGKQVCCIADSIVSFGVIKLDGTKSKADLIELRMVGDTAEKRKIKLNKNAALLLYGKSGLDKGKKNVVLASPKLPEQKDDILSLIETDGFVSIDWQRAMINEVRLQGMKIDNTGSKANERLNIIENQFVGRSRIFLHTCDTAVVSKNTFEYADKAPLPEAAISLAICPLAEVKHNTIRGPYQAGLLLLYQGDYAIEQNTIDGCGAGIAGRLGVPNSTIRQCVIRNCETGISLDDASGIIEDTVVEGAMTAFHHEKSNLQLTNFQIKDLNPKGTAINFVSGKLSLLNCNILPGQIKIAAQPATAKDDPVTCWQYAVIAAKGAPADSLIELRTNDAKLAADAPDPNVRNMPAPLVNGLTPLPKTLNPLIVRSWTIDLKGKLNAGPEYNVKVLGPAAKEGTPRPVLKMATYRPAENAFRASLDDGTPTLEVNLK
jgi:hypothetical protein